MEERPRPAGGRPLAVAPPARAIVGPHGGGRVDEHRVGPVSGPFGGVAEVRRGGEPIGGGRGFVAGHSTHYVNTVALRDRAATIRRGYVGHPYFTPDWYRSHPLPWLAPRWVFGNSLWYVPGWGALAPWCNINGPPLLYDYGSNVVFDNNLVYINGQQTITTAQYADQAYAFDDQGRQAQPGPNDEWQQLGVFGLIQDEETNAQRIFQLAVNKQGIVRGNYYDAVADSSQPIYGYLDPRSQRTVWSIGDKRNVVFEAGLNNLTQNQTPVLVHFGKDRTQQMTFVRLPAPPGN